MKIYANRCYECRERFWYTDMVCEDLVRTFIILKGLDGWGVWDMTEAEIRGCTHPESGWCSFSGTLRECKKWVEEHLMTEHKEVRHGR